MLYNKVYFVFFFKTVLWIPVRLQLLNKRTPSKSLQSIKVPYTTPSWVVVVEDSQQHQMHAVLGNVHFQVPL